MVIKKNAKYESIDEALDASVALWQAATILEAAAEEALRNHDTAALIEISAGWTNIAQYLLPTAEAQEEGEAPASNEENKPIRIGFGGHE